MHHFSTFLIVLGSVLAFASLSKKVEHSLVSLPIVFSGIGFVLSGNEFFSTGVGRNVVHTLAEVTLILVLFFDATRIRLSGSTLGYRSALRMLVIGMPLTILLGTFVAHAVSPDQSWALALLIAAILTPTDAALAQSVVTSPNVPRHLSEAINVESGLNDGLALPIVLIAAILTAGTSGMSIAENGDGPGLFIMKQVLLGPIVGLLIAYVAAQILNYAIRSDSVATSFQGIYFLASAFLVWLCAEAVGGNGFIAVFVGGAVFGNRLQSENEFIPEFMEGEGQILSMATFLAFGAVLLPEGLAHVSISTFILAVLFLTVVRMLPIWISLIGLGLSVPDKLFLGWFGPRGLASILFALLIAERRQIPGREEVLACVVLAVGLSILLHGMTATPFSKRIGRT